jgi:hypothetical protein
VLDSGCSQHITGDSRMFNSLKSNDSGIDSITFGDNSKGDVKGLGYKADYQEGQSRLARESSVTRSMS